MALNSPSLEDLATIIKVRASKISDLVEKYGLCEPSFSVDGSRDRDFNGSLETQGVRLALIQAATDTVYFAVGPEKYMKYQSLTVCFQPYTNKRYHLTLIKLPADLLFLIFLTNTMCSTLSLSRDQSATLNSQSKANAPKPDFDASSKIQLPVRNLKLIILSASNQLWFHAPLRAFHKYRT